MEASISLNILTHFEGQGIYSNQSLAKEELYTILDILLRKNSKLRFFSPKIKSKLWQQCKKNHDGTIMPSDFANIYSKEFIMIASTVAKIEQEVKDDATPLEDKIKLKKKLALFKTELKYLTYPFQDSLNSISQEFHLLPSLKDRVFNPQNKIEKKEKEQQDVQKEQDEQRQEKIRGFIAEKLNFEKLRHEKGDLFLQVYLKEKGISEKALQFFRENKIDSIEELSDVSEFLADTDYISSNDSIILKDI